MDVQAVKYMLMAEDMNRAVAFYRDVIGLVVEQESPYWSELVAPSGAIVALHGGGDGGFKETGLSFQVNDLEGAVQEVTAGGGEVRSGPEERPGEPIKLADVTDPEGNGFMLTQFVG